jgi:hypothetical protein
MACSICFKNPLPYADTIICIDCFYHSNEDDDNDDVCSDVTFDSEVTFAERLCYICNNTNVAYHDSIICIDCFYDDNVINVDDEDTEPQEDDTIMQ